MAQSEYRKIFHAGPCRLFKEDIYTLVDILRSEIPTCTTKDDFEISTDIDGYYIRENDLDLFFSRKELPNKFNKLYIRIIGWKNDGNLEIDKSVNITLHVNYVDFQIASKNKIWFSGTSSLLLDFFKKRKPWFSFLDKILPFFSGVLPLIFLVAFIYLIKIQYYLFSVGAFILLAFSIVVATFYLKNKLVPFVEIILKPKKSILNINTFLIIIGILTLIFTAIGVIKSFF
jgi:hypothetical protein